MAETPGPVWVNDGVDADRAIEAITAADVAGYDSEFWGVDISEESPVLRSKLDVFSIAIPTNRLHPLGYYIPRGWVFAPSFITHPSVRSYLEDSSKLKCVHNLAVDSHTARNAGVRLRGAIDTLNFARWVYPQRANLPKGNFDLDSLCRWRVGIGKSEDFDEFLGYWVDESYQTTATKNRCVGCFELGCRKKKPPHDLGRVPEEVEVTRTKKVRKYVHLPDIRPDGPRMDIFERYLRYAASDAELALIIYQMMQRDGQKERPYPYGL